MAGVWLVGLLWVCWVCSGYLVGFIFVLFFFIYFFFLGFWFWWDFVGPRVVVVIVCLVVAGARG